MVLVLGCPSVLVLPKEKPVVWVVMAWANGLLKRLVFCWFCWPKRPPGFVPNPVVPFRKIKKRKINEGKKTKTKTLQTSYYLVTATVYVGDYISKLPNIHSLFKLITISFSIFFHLTPDLVQTLIPLATLWPQESGLEKKQTHGHENRLVVGEGGGGLGVWG